MMGIDRFDPANFTGFPIKLACLYCALHSKVCFILAGIGTAPIGLTGISFEHRLVLPLEVCRLSCEIRLTQHRLLAVAAGFQP